MALSPGDRLGPYEIVGALGAGGMGEVYRASDTTLNRSVALKILPDMFAADPDRLARFTREAQTLAALNHPNIAQIYGVHDGPYNGSRLRALVMELVDGEDLSQRLSRGALPLDEALAIATQIATALEAAHEQGIVHRDLKPANVKRRPDGTVKVLDFGLAKAMDTGAQGSDLRSLSPTITSPALATGVGVLLGTAAYMSPEQAKGRPADKRSDIWAFGCVLFEMLTGRQLFTGETVTEVLAAVMKDAPAFDALPPNTPAGITALLRRCLDRDPKQRLRDIGEARIAISDALEGGGEPSAQPAAGTAPRAGSAFWRVALPWAVAAIALAVLGTVLMRLAPWRTVTPPAPLRLSTELGVDASLDMNFGAAAVLSPDGTMLAFVAQPAAGAARQFYVRSFGSLEATALSGTSDARDPFFSPDGDWVAFFAEGKLKKVAITKGAPITLADAPNARGGAWGDDDTIVFQPINAAGVDVGMLMRVSSSGGMPERLLPLSDGEVTQRWPQVLPGGAVLFTSHVSTTLGYEDGSILVQAMPAGERKVLVRGGYFARYVPTGHVVYMHQGTLFAAPFDLDRLELTGAAAPILEGVTTNAGFGGAQYAVATNGTLTYTPGGIETRDSNGGPLTMVDRAGKLTPLRPAGFSWGDIRFAPDGRRLAMVVFNDAGVDIWTLEIARDALSRLTFGPDTHRSPAWTPDGNRIAYAKGGQVMTDLYWQRADGGDSPQRLTQRPSAIGGLSFDPTGTRLAFAEYRTRSPTAWDLMVMPLEGNDRDGWKPGEPAPFLTTASSERDPTFSPDGRWMAYSSDETGQPEIYVRPFPGPGGKWQISTGGGRYPAWSPAGAELLFSVNDADGTRIMAAAFAVKGEAFVAERPRPWSTGHVGLQAWSLHPDGTRVAAAPQDTRALVKRDKVVLFLNFFDELRRVAP